MTFLKGGKGVNSLPQINSLQKKLLKVFLNISSQLVFVKMQFIWRWIVRFSHSRMNPTGFEDLASFPVTYISYYLPHLQSVKGFSLSTAVLRVRACAAQHSAGAMRTRVRRRSMRQLLSNAFRLKCLASIDLDFLAGATCTFLARAESGLPSYSHVFSACMTAFCRRSWKLLYPPSLPLSSSIHAWQQQTIPARGTFFSPYR